MMAQRDSKVPQIRFKGFEGEWNSLKLGELGKVATNKRIFIHQTSSTGDVPFYKIGTFGKQPKLFISQELFEAYKERFPYPQKGDLLISVIGSIGRVVEYRGEDEYFQDSNIVWLQHNGAIVNSFLKQFYSFVKWSGIEGSTIKHLYNKNILETQIHLPSQKEQSQIGAYFQNLDCLIGEHLRKHEKLMTLKEAMLKKMFPAPGATTPEIRFKGFSRPWEEKKLSDISTKVTEKNASKEYSETFTNSAEFGVISQRDYFDKDISNSENLGGYYVVQADDFVYNPRISSFAPCGPINRNKLGRAGVMSPLYTVFSTKKIDNTFLEFFFKTEIWHSFMFLNGDMGARSDRFSIKDSIFNELPIPYSEIEEQQKIGDYFRRLDELIAQHGTQVEKLRQLKAACLEKMFV